MFRRLLLLAVIVFGAWWLLPQLQEAVRGPTAPCDRPLTWDFGAIDQRFGMDRVALHSVMAEVEAVWNAALDRELIAHGNDGDVAIDFVYDERQSRTESARVALGVIDDVARAQGRLEDDRDAAVAHYEQARRDFERELGVYNVRVARHNEAVAYWNARGGAPAAEHARFEQERTVIARHAERVEVLRREMERLREAANERIDRFNEAVAARNELVDRFNTRYAGQRRFSQGEYRADAEGRNIRIFQFGDVQELTVVLAHEIGHALGLDHVDNPASVMYYLMTEANVRGNRGLSDEDIEAVRSLCGVGTNSGARS